jgi:hypothetical protein
MARVRATTLLGNYNPTALVAYASSITAALATNVATFPTPPVALATINTEIANLVTAIATWGPVGARGSHADLIALRAQVLSVQFLLRTTANYVNIVATGSAFVVSLSGFTGTNPHTVVGVLSPPQNFRQLVTAKTLPKQVIIKWSKPLNIGFGKVASYLIEARIAATNTWVPVAISTRTKATIENLPYVVGSNAFDVRVRGINSAGNGAPTNTLTVTALGI